MSVTTNLVHCTATPAGVTRLGGRRYRVRASTPRVDAMGDSIDQLAWEIEGEVPLLLGHDYSKLEIGVVHVDRISPDGLDVIVEFLPAGLSADADDVVRRIEAGYPPRFSVGFQVTRNPVPNKAGGNHYAGQRLMELSVVSVPANNDAKLVGAVRSLDRAPIAAWLISKGLRPLPVTTTAVTGLSTRTAPEYAPGRVAQTGARPLAGEVRTASGTSATAFHASWPDLLRGHRGPAAPIDKSGPEDTRTKAAIAARVAQQVRDELSIRQLQLRHEAYSLLKEREQWLRRSW